MRSTTGFRAKVVARLGATLLAASALCCRAPQPPRSVILVSIDTLRPDHLGCYGYRQPTSPNVDAFARESVLFREAIAQAPSTLASHASLLTSLNPPHHAASIANNLALPHEVITLAETLRRQGYATASFNGGIQLDAVWGLDQGFDTYLSVKPRTAGAESLVDAKDRFEYVVGLAMAWIEQNETRPFFLFLHTYEVHHPYTPYAADLEPFRGTYAGRLPDKITVDVLRRINDGRVPIDDRDRQHVVNTYDGEIRSMDRAFGGLVRFLRAHGLYDGALIVFTSDHGEEFGEHGRMGWHTHSLFDELLRIPLLMKLPAARLAGTAIDGQVRSIDVAPTVLAALGLDAPRQFAGRDLLSSQLPAFAAGTEAFSSRDVVEPNESVAVRTPEWKLYDGRLYNLTRDRRETEDVARQNADEARRLRNRLQAMLAARRRPAKRTAAPDAELLERLRSLGYVE